MEEGTSKWRGRRVLVTGCTGFLGSAVTAELLHQQAHVIGLVDGRTAGAIFHHEREAGLFLPIQGRTENIFRLHSGLAIHEVSVIFHLADESADSKVSAALRTANSIANDRGTAAVLRAAALYHPRLPVIVARPSNQLRILNSEAGETANPLGIARFGEIFGENDQNPSRVVPRTIAALLGQENRAANESASRDFVFVRDAARACLQVAEAVGSRLCSIDTTFRSGWDLTESEMAGIVSTVFAGRMTERTFEDTPANPFGWRPSISLTDAVRETIESYRSSARQRTESTRPSRSIQKAA